MRTINKGSAPRQIRPLARAHAASHGGQNIRPAQAGDGDDERPAKALAIAPVQRLQLGKFGWVQAFSQRQPARGRNPPSVRREWPPPASSGWAHISASCSSPRRLAACKVAASAAVSVARSANGRRAQTRRITRRMLEHCADGGNKTSLSPGRTAEQGSKSRHISGQAVVHALAYELARPAGKRRRDIMLLPVAIYDRTDPAQTLHCAGLCANRHSPHASPAHRQAPYNQAHRTLFCESRPWDA